jgi:hypothetical protein
MRREFAESCRFHVGGEDRPHELNQTSQFRELAQVPVHDPSRSVPAFRPSCVPAGATAVSVLDSTCDMLSLLEIMGSVDLQVQAII